MTDELSVFWNWYIVIPTLLGIAGCLWLVLANSRGPKDGVVETTDHVWDEDLQEYNNPLPRWWLNLFYITFVFGVVYLALYPGLGNFKGFLNWTQLGQYEAEVAKAEETFSPMFESYAKTSLSDLAKDKNGMTTASRLYSTYCSTCHGSDARGATGFPNLRDNDWLYGSDPDVIKMSILNGRVGMMPAWEAPLGGETGVVEVSEFVRSLSGQEYNGDLAAAGGIKYQQFCIACHGADGKGNTALGAPNLTDNIWLYGGSPEALKTTIAKGRQGIMPAHKDFLGEQKVHLLAAYIYSLGKQTAANNTKD